MALIGPVDLLATWERGLALPEPDRAFELHRAARADVGAEELLRAPVGTREADLYALRRALFGDRLEALADCAACGEAMEFELDAAALAARATAEPDGEPLRIAADGWEVEFRPPTAGDVAAAVSGEPSGDPSGEPSGAPSGEPSGAPSEDLAGNPIGDLPGELAGDLAGARRRLVARCVLAAYRDGRPCEVDDLPEPILRRLAEEAERADPAGEVTLRVRCPECGAATAAELDIAAYLWAELDSWARDLLLDVHLLARAYGWTEPEILALSPLRRRYYLELCADA